MSLTDTHTSHALAQDPGTTSWAPEINDLQKYRESLKIMAERVSQAEDMWAKSLEPPRYPQSLPSKSRHARKPSKPNRPTPLRCHFPPKRIRIETGNCSPDPLQVLSPYDMLDHTISPSIESSADLSPVMSPASTSSRKYKRAANELDHASSDVNTERILKRVEDLLYDAQQLVRKTIEATQSTRRSEDQPDATLAAKSRAAAKQVRNSMVQVRNLMADARRQSMAVPSERDLFEDPLDAGDEDTFTAPAEPHERLSMLESRLKAWVESVASIRERVAAET